LTLGEFDMLSTYLRSIGLRNVVGAFLCVAAISACGGGGSKSNPPPPAARYTVGGMVTGLSNASLVLLDNGADSLTVSSSGAFTFKTALLNGAPYAVTIATQPIGASCTVSMGTGTIATANVTNVSVACTATAATTYTIGGLVSGLGSGLSLTLLDNGADAFTPTANGAFTFKTPLAGGASYAVTIGAQPTGENCTISNASGIIAAANVTNIAIVCAATTASRAWIWESGSNAADAAAVYGTKGTASTGNVPGARSNAATWTDAAGNLWLFGGDAFATGYLNDLWEYNPNADTWTWVGGSNTGEPIGIYGTMGTPSTGNVPGGRAFATSWIDSAGNLWLFGGMGEDSTGALNYLNDLWEYSPSAKTWTWVSGSNVVNASGVYGTVGTPAVGNVPGARDFSVSWIDATGNLWLFGGTGYDSTGNQDYLNDLWEFSPTAKTWTWVSGSKLVDANGVYGTQGTQSASNVPGARNFATSWTDAAGNLWLFGGSGPSNETAAYFNDLWKFNPSAQAWTWVNGSDSINAFGVYGTMGTASAGNAPGARFSALSWIDATGNLWMFGGSGFDSSGASGEDLLNDLWEYSPSANTWTWINGVDGIDAAGIYGTKGTAAASNQPGARYFAVSWADHSGNFWLFGGIGYSSTGQYSSLNDLWKFTP
jgi:N-acetylneuraminic acid mutarotase